MTFPTTHCLRWRHYSKSCSNLLFPSESILAEDLSRRLEVLSAIKEDGSDHNFISHHSLVMIDVRGAVGTVIAIDWLSRVAIVSVRLCFTLRDL